MESIILELNSATDWDGTTPTILRRDDGVVTGQRYYKFDIEGPHGLLAPDFGGLFSPVSVKLVGIAYSAWNPAAKARVIASDATGIYRQEITLKPEVQFVTMFPNDRLALLTTDTAVQVVLVVNELSEAESITWGLRHEPSPVTTRFRIIRTDGAAFAPGLTLQWQPEFVYDPTRGLMVAVDDGAGVIPSTSLCLFPRSRGCYVSVRYAGSNSDGKLHMHDRETNKSWIAETALADVRWSKVQYICNDDGLALEATPGVAGSKMVCDIEVAPVEIESRLRARYMGGA